MNKLTLVKTSFLHNATYLAKNVPLCMTDLKPSKIKYKAQTEICTKFRLSKTKRQNKDFFAKSRMKFEDPQIEKRNNDIQYMLTQGIDQYNNTSSISLSQINKRGTKQVSINKDNSNDYSNDTIQELNFEEKQQYSPLSKSKINKLTILSQNYVKPDMKSFQKDKERDKDDLKRSIIDIIDSSFFDHSNHIKEEDEITGKNNKNYIQSKENNAKVLTLNKSYLKSTTISQALLKKYKTIGQVKKYLLKKRKMISLPNVYDSFCEEETEIEDAKDAKFILYQDSTFMIIWNIIITLFMLYSLILSPYLLAFSLDKGIFQLIDIISDIIFLINMGLSFFLAYYDDDEDLLIVSKSKIACHYLKTFFVFDLLSSIPFSIVSVASISFTTDLSKKINAFQKISKITKFYRILKWTRLIKVLKYSDKEKKNLTHYFKDMTKTKVGQISKFIFLLLLIIHLSASLWIFIANINEYSPDNWITFHGLNELSNGEKYLTAVHFIIGSMLTDGYGDITPKSTEERLFVIFFLIVGCMLYSLMLTALSAIFSHIDFHTLIFRKKEFLLDQIRRDYKIPHELYNNIKKTLHHDYIKWKDDQLKLLDSLPGSLKNNLYLKMNENQIKHLKFFNNQSYDFILFSVPFLKSVRFSREEMLINVGNVLEEMYLIIRGMISIRLGYKYENYELGVLKSGDYFGDIIMYLNDQCNYELKIKSKYAELFCLSKSNFATIKLNCRTSTDEILKRSFVLFEKLEDKRHLAIQFYKAYNTFEGFKEMYLKNNQDSGIYGNEEDSQFKDSMRTCTIITNNKNISSTNIDDIFSMRKKMAMPRDDGSFLSSLNNITTNNYDNNCNRSKNESRTIVPQNHCKQGNLIQKELFIDDKRKKSKLLDNTISDINKSIDISCSSRDRVLPLKSNSKANDDKNKGNPKSKYNMIYINNLNINFTNNSNPNPIFNSNTSQTNIIPVRSKPKTKTNTNTNFNNKRLSYSPNSSSFENGGRAVSGSLLQLRNNRMTNNSLRDEKRMSLYQKDVFLQKLNEKIEIDAMMESNQVLLDDYIVEFLNAKEAESNMMKIINKLNKIEKELVSFDNENYPK